MDRGFLAGKRRIVVKVGTSTLTHTNGRVNFKSIDRLARVLADVSNMGKDVVLVSSGAIGVGMGKLGIVQRPASTAERQAIAAIGQCELMQIYSKFFSEYGYAVGQILLTRDVVDSAHMRANAVNTFETLLQMGTIPIVNENDSVSTEELENNKNNGFGDNDTLSVIVAALVGADLLVMLSDIQGFYSHNPRTDPDATLMRYIGSITPQVELAAGGVGSLRGTGGMATKIEAAKIALGRGIDMVLASGEDPAIIYDILSGADVGTLFARERV